MVRLVRQGFDVALKKSLSLFDIVLMNLVAVTSFRWIAAAGSNGFPSITLWILAVILFFAPQGLAVAELSSRFPGQGGLYRWTRDSLNDRHGFLCGWCYWICNLVYFPSLLLFVSANLAFVAQSFGYLADPQQAKNFVVLVTLGNLWLVALLNIFGMHVAKWLQNFGALGNYVPAAIIAGLGIVALVLHGSATPFHFSDLLPKIHDPKQLTFFSQMCFAFAGLELVSFLGGEIENPKKTITQGIVIAAFLITGVYLIGTLGILLSVSQEKITTVNGILLPIREAGKLIHAAWLSTVSGVFIALAGVGATMAWFAGAARVPYIVSVDKYLPRWFGDLHPKWQTPVTAIFVQMACATVLTLFATAGSATQVEAAYQVLVDMCIVLYFIPYCYLFISLFRNRKRTNAELNNASLYLIPGGTTGVCVVAITGLLVTSLAIVTTIIPLGQTIDWGSFAKTTGGTFLMIALGILIYWRGNYQKKRTTFRTPGLNPAEAF